MKDQMIRVISSPSSSTRGVFTWILAMRRAMLCDHGRMGRSGSSYQLMRIAGIRVGVDASWFLILFLAIFFLQDAYKTEVSGSDTTAYVAAVATALLFFGSTRLPR